MQKGHVRCGKETTLKHLALAMVVPFFTACSSLPPNTRLGSEPETSSMGHVDASAWAADAMTYNKPMIIRPKTDAVFYSKHCEQVTSRTWISKTDYSCSYP